MISSGNIAKFKQTSCSSIQKEYYHPSGPIDAKFTFSPAPSAWAVKDGPCKMEKNILDTNNDTICYNANKNYDMLLNTYAEATIPKIEIIDEFKDKIRCAWAHNLGVNIFQTGQLVCKNIKIQTIDNIYHDGKIQFFCRGGPESRMRLRQMIGSIPELEEFRNVHEKQNLYIIHPWSFHDSRFQSIPVHMVKDVNFVFNLKLRLDKLVRMEKFIETEGSNENSSGINGYWKPIHYDPQYLKNPPEKISIPDYWGYYAKCDEGENDERCENSGHQVKYEDIICIDSDNPITSNRYSSRLHSKYPAAYLFFMAENLNASEYNDLSNYTDQENRTGKNPIQNVSLYFKDEPAFENLPIEHLSLVSPFIDCPSVSIEEGYNIYSFGFNIRSINIDNGLILEKLMTKLIVDPIDQKTEIKTNYRIHIRIVTNRLVRFSDDNVEILGENEIVSGQP